jgi:DNA helicase-2/ATP-dependent DNA helicase PcrA
MLNVPVEQAGDLERLYNYVVEPAYRNDCALFVQATQDIEGLEAERFIEPAFGYPWTFERLQHLVARYCRRSVDESVPPMTPIEAKLLDAMRRIGLSPRVQHGIGPYRADFAFPERLLIVEADGRGWHDAERDRARDRHLETDGWKTLRFSGSRIWREADRCAAEIAISYNTLAEALKYSELDYADDVKPSWWKRFFDWLRHFLVKPAIDLLPAAVTSDDSGKSMPSFDWNDGLDNEQRAAVTAHEGVVQVIAPAGSGKTRVLVARVRELVTRGIPEERILCTTFNKATETELRARLGQAGVGKASVRTFHSIGRYILREEGRLRSKVGTLSYPQWRRLSMMAKERPGSVWIDASKAIEIVSKHKLAGVTPEEAVARAIDPIDKTTALIYTLYENELKKIDKNDFDDLVINAVRLLKSDEEVRRRWQEKWECLLVDEYQDIEPAQELLIQLLAAPEDCLMVVGDEDQCIYTWRRAEVERIVNLDKRYPGLERVILTRCYRCPTAVVKASANMIRVNKRRFPKDVIAGNRDSHPDAISLHSIAEWGSAAATVAKSLQGCDPSETVVLARTTKLLREVALACLASGIQFKANEKVLKPAESERILLAYLRLLSNPRSATQKDVDKVFRVPNRYLPRGKEHDVTQRLRRGDTFRAAVDALEVEDWRRPKLIEGADFLDSLSREAKAEKIIHELRTQGGLDKYYSDQEKMSSYDQAEIEALESVLAESRGKTPTAVAKAMEAREELLHQAMADNGVELATIHGSKGREWTRVLVFGWNDDQIPHKRVLKDIEERVSEGGDSGLRECAIEDERRLAYVALTRTKSKVELFYSMGKQSRFLSEF